MQGEGGRIIPNEDPFLDKKESFISDGKKLA